MTENREIRISNLLTVVTTAYSGIKLGTPDLLLHNCISITILKPMIPEKRCQKYKSL